MLAFGSELVKEAMATEGLGLERSGWGWQAGVPRAARLSCGWAGAGRGRRKKTVKEYLCQKKRGNGFVVSLRDRVWVVTTCACSLHPRGIRSPQTRVWQHYPLVFTTTSEAGGDARLHRRAGELYFCYCGSQV